MSDSLNAWPPRTRRLRIGDLCIDLHCRRVQRPDAEIELPQRMFELLLVFAAEPHTVHTRTALLQRVWPGVIVEDSNLSQSVWILRRALGEARKDWIRTVAKKGYVFEPPAPVQAIETSAAAEAQAEDEQRQHAPVVAISDANAGDVVHHERADRGRVERKRPHRWAGYAAAAMLIVIVATAGALHEAKPPAATARAQDVSQTPASVTLVEVDDPGMAPQHRLPAALLHAWLEWKLSALPEVTMLTQAHLAANAPAQTSSTRASNVVVLIASGPLPDDPSRIFLQARFEDARGPQRVQVEGTPAELGTLVDTVSRRVMQTLLPRRAQQPWPTLQVDQATARRYMDMLRARAARDRIKTIEIGRELATRAPQFALARLHLAQTLAGLGQLPSAQEHMAAAKALLQPLPPDVLEVIAAQQLALSPRHEEAAAAYAQLSARYPQQTAFSLQHARALGRTGRFADALAVLSKPVWQRPQPVAIQVSHLTNRSHFELSLGEHVLAQASARKADRLAAAAGEGWEYERGQALLARAQADVYAANGSRGSPFFAQAAVQFEKSGDTFSALRARFQGETAGPGNDPPEHLDAWLAQTRAAGQRQLELDALRAAAFRHYRAGDIAKYRARLIQAVAVADAMDDDWGHAALDLDLLNEGFMRGDTANVEQNLKRLSRNGVQGDMAIWTSEFAAWLALDRGRYPEALAAIKRGERQARAERPASAPASGLVDMLACTRATLSLVQGQPEKTRGFAERCGSANDLTSQLSERLLIAESELMSGDWGTAMRGLRTVQTRLADIPIAPARWVLSLDLAALLTRAGDIDAAARLYNEILPLAQSADYRRLEAYARIGMAENAVVKGDLAAARGHADAARPLLATDNWNPGYRLKLLDIAIARKQGDLQTAERMLATVHRAAHERGDVISQALTHSVMSPLANDETCTNQQRIELLARSGLRGATLDWLMPPVEPARALTVETRRR